ncbi:MAG: hypothetical protein WC302_00870 [Candidatus Paceibacterota bacterium]|jgi:hypothetical protein
MNQLNQLNYASLEASKRLFDAGIALETEAIHRVYANGSSRLMMKDISACSWEGDIPAPSMAEVWRELPECYYTTASQSELHFNMTKTHCGYTGEKGDGFMIPYTNHTDALIDLLIWIRKEKP